ncbi:hypothetical protein FE697_007655 [Mumia zhuanghuii]|uniref:Integral membrane protein n=2 Tax=Mumia TaxID=1546255 RepID=A0ABW1QMW8_9ACTN|nr:MULTISPECIES: hypothetical protein [Mumia]KAA1423470.1 hypothetical protein FE697_007655 [Mumia zhuanghuii]
MSTKARARTTGGAAAVGIAQCLVLTLGSLVVVTWSFLEVSESLVTSTAPLTDSGIVFWSLVGGMAVLVLACVASLMLWRGRAAGFTVLGLAWLPALPLAWVTVTSYLDLVADDRMPGLVAVSVVLCVANLVLGWVVRISPATRPPVAG